MVAGTGPGVVPELVPLKSVDGVEVAHRLGRRGMAMIDTMAYRCCSIGRRLQLALVPPGSRFAS